MWQCDNCGYTDEEVTAFEEDTEEGLEDTIRYCPECGSDEVFQVDDEDGDSEDFEEGEAEDDDGDDDLEPDDDEDEDDDDWDDNGRGDDDGDDDW